MREHRPRHPAETEAWTLASLRGAWRGRVHPAFADPGPILDWTAVRAAAADGPPWSQVRAILTEIQTGARAGASGEGEPDEGDEDR